ncbi:MAG: hypothetical protein LBU50_05715 [Cellulomonas sp.]|nr:hypothetical protein [Cellulomonas sp.]
MTPAAVADALTAGGARPWQVEITTGLLTEALGRSAGAPTGDVP